MIFKKFFSSKKKWQSDKVSDRLAAVAEFDATIATNKSTLHELAFNDGDEKVRRAALDKLADFSLWWQAYKKDNSEAIKKLAEKNIINALTAKGELALSDKEKHTFISECSNNQLLQQVVFDLDDESLVLNTLARLNRETLIFKAITDSALSDDAKTSLLADIGNESVLRKLSKKLQGTLLEYVETKLAEIKLATEKPIKLEKQARLLLAQLNALKDKSDFTVINDRHEHIDSEWQKLTAEFDILTDQVKNELTQKRDSIKEALARILAPIKQAWLEQQELEKQQATQQQNFDNILAELSAIESQVTQAIADDADIDQEGIAAAINLLSVHCNEQDLKPEDKSELLTRAENLFNRANQVPKIKAGITAAKQICQSFAELSLPTDLISLNEVNPVYKSLKKQWQDNLKAVDLALPADISAQYETLVHAWGNVVPELEKQQRQLMSQTRRKLSELESLVHQGRFHNAFGLYKKLSFWFEELNDYQKNQLERKWQKAQEEVEKLQELEKSFSNPKKQELLVDIEKLAENPLPDPTEQAHRVRLLRSNWQSLGHAGDEEEDSLNNTFNEFCEKAFVTCREHYKQLEDDRHANLEAKNLIIEQLETLLKNLKTSEVSSWRDVESLYVKLSRLWRETGLIDRERVNEVNKRYHAAVKPIRNAINDHHKHNEEAKQQLINKAKAIVDKDLVLTDKTNQLKQLQNQWQEIGFAGKNKDQALWNEFRAVNNPVFEQRDEAKQQQQAQSQAEYESVKTKLTEVSDKLANCHDIAAIRELSSANEEIMASVKDLAKSQFESLRKQSQKIAKTAETKIVDIRKAQEKQIYLDLFNAVEDLANGKPADTGSLKPSWVSAINLNNKEDRKEVTLKLELSAGLDSPEEDKAQRNQIQMGMLSAKMEQGVDFDSQELLETWLSAGVFENQDLTLLERIKPIFL